MSDKPTLLVEPRSGTGSHASHKVRTHGRIPGVLYGHGETPQPVSLDAVTFRRQITPEHYGAAIVALKQGEQSLGSAIVKAVQIDTLHGKIMHVDLQRVSAEDRIHVALPIVLQGEPAGAHTGGVLEQTVHTVNIRCRAADVPSEITFDVSALEVGDSVHVEQLALPAGSELLDKPDEVIAVIGIPNTPALEEPVTVNPDVAGPELTGEKQKSSTES